MKKIMMKAGLFFGVVIMLSGCNDEIVWDESVGLVGFSTPLVTMAEGETVSLGIFYSAPSGNEANDIVLAVSNSGLPVPASEGTDYTLSSKSINMKAGSTTIDITATDDEGFTGNKSFYITILSNSFNCPVAVPSAVKVIILEDEHPLTSWVGSYIVSAESYYGNSVGEDTYDEVWLTVTTDIVPSDPTKLQIRGIAAEGSGPIVAILDPETMTIEIEPGQSLGIPYIDYGEITVYYGTDDLISNAGYPITQDMLNESATHNITGTLQSNGNILIDRFADIDAGSLISYDVFNTTWVKQ